MPCRRPKNTRSSCGRTANVEKRMRTATSPTLYMGVLLYFSPSPPSSSLTLTHKGKKSSVLRPQGGFGPMFTALRLCGRTFDFAVRPVRVVRTSCFLKFEKFGRGPLRVCLRRGRWRRRLIRISRRVREATGGGRCILPATAGWRRRVQALGSGRGVGVLGLSSYAPRQSTEQPLRAAPLAKRQWYGAQEPGEVPADACELALGVQAPGVVVVHYGGLHSGYSFNPACLT